MNKCQKCGTYVPIEQEFCQNCGAPMTPEAEARRQGASSANNLAETIAVPSMPQHTQPQPPGATTGRQTPPGDTSNPNSYGNVPPTSFPPPPAHNYNAPTAAAPAKSRTGLYIGLGLGALVLGGILLVSVIGALFYFASDSENRNANVIANNNANANNRSVANNNSRSSNTNSSASTAGRNAEDPESANDRPITDRK